MDRNATFSELNVRCAAGDVFLLYTDGVVESTSRSGEQFGAERLKAVLVGVPCTGRPRSFVKLWRMEAESFRGPGKATDDLTVVAVKVG